MKALNHTSKTSKETTKMDKKELWFDLILGDEIKPGDRCYGNNDRWFEMTEEHLVFHKTINKCSRLIQRQFKGKDYEGT